MRFIGRRPVSVAPVALPRGEVVPFWPEPLPSAAGRGLRDGLVPFFWPAILGWFCALAIGMRMLWMQREPPSSLTVAAAAFGYLLAALACRRAGMAMASEPLRAIRVDRLFGVGSVLIAAGIGSLVLVALAAHLPWRTELLAIMLVMAILGVAQGTAVARPWIGAMQVVAITVPTACGMAMFWTGWVASAAALGLIAYALLVVAMAWRVYLTQVALVQARDEQRAERGRLATAVANMPFAFVVVDERLWPITWNRQAVALLRLTGGVPVDRSFVETLAGAPDIARNLAYDRENFIQRAEALTRGSEPFDTVIRCGEGRILDIEAQPIDGGGWVLVLRDTTGEHQALAELNREARRCPLTGLPNRRAFMEALTARLAPDAAAQPFALLLADIDSFKKINETWGHQTGDRVLGLVGMRLRTLHDGLFVARLGGDEFAILVDLPGAGADAAGDGDGDANHALHIAAALGADLEPPLRLDGNLIQIHLATGIALAPRDGGDAATLMRAADLALIAAKQRHGGGIEAFTPQLIVDAERRNRTEQRVRTAVRGGTIDVGYQPIVDLAAGRVCAVEALVRWRDDGGEPISTEALVAITEQRGLVAQLRRKVLAEAAVVVAGHDPGLALWCNVSALDLLTPGFAEEIAACLAGAGLSPARVCLEITETALMTDEAASVAALVAVRALGLRIAMDDFGAGFSSLDRLRRLPIDELKISGRLIAGAGVDASAASIFGAAARLGQTIDLGIVAEGIETRAELDLATAFGIARVQGFLFAPAVSGTALRETITAAEARLATLALPGQRLRVVRPENRNAVSAE